MFPMFLFSTILSPCASNHSSTTVPSRCEVSVISGTFVRGNHVMDCVIVRIVFGDAVRQSSTTSPDCSAIDKPIEAIIFAPLPISGLFETVPDRTNSQWRLTFAFVSLVMTPTCVNCREIPVVGALRVTSPQHHHQSSWNGTPIANEHGAEF
ncbi:hypothetical protein BLNAU_21705 [Blattamonas nauphoetae]|uniref:Secreted protein n=1 Tax=Blattamonas nauphoetae TaxID=2049346 RepID=A0ABQ9WV77_9EUKA|nr:hypothetical protein BLNAU_24696 [Blattamonas nauphoetae]KAK2943395.1 hypothetical protein BLNAU_21705 [Blattamonas nauphoetae]